MKTALVLAGGGAKGAYQAGCLKALDELKQEYDIVTGTSIGALNGLLIVQRDLPALYHLWDTITIKDVLKNPINFDFSIDSILSQTNLIKPFFTSYLNEKGADISPLLSLLDSLYNEKKFYDSPIDYGVVTVKFPSLQPIEISKKQMPKNTPLQYAIASASCFPAFPIHYIDKAGYIDGGYYDNVPISLAMSLGATRIIALELSTEVSHPHFENRPNIIMVRPSHDLGGFLDFSRDKLDIRKQLGYFDTLKTFGELKGFKYTFEHETINTLQQEFFYQLILNYENKVSRTYSISSDSPITKKLLEKTYKQSLALEDYLVIALEITMKLYNYKYTKLYNYQEVSKKLYQTFLKEYKKSNVHERGFSIKKYAEMFKDFTTKEIIFYLYEDLLNKDLDISIISTLKIEEFITALYFYTLTKTSNIAD